MGKGSGPSAPALQRGERLPEGFAHRGRHLSQRHPLLLDSGEFRAPRKEEARELRLLVRSRKVAQGRIWLAQR